MRTGVCLSLLAVCLLGASQSEASLKRFLSRSGGDRSKEISDVEQSGILDRLSDPVLRAAERAGNQAVAAFVLKRDLKRRTFGRLSRTSPAYFHAQFSKSRTRGRRLNGVRRRKCSIFLTAALRFIRTRLALNAKQTKWLNRLRFFSQQNRVEQEAARRLRMVSEFCVVRPVQDCEAIANNPFRTFDGRCNNLDNPEFGTSDRAFARFLPPAYEDGLDSPRSVSASGGMLPNPRKISLELNERSSDVTDVDDRITHIVMQWGQFMDHDLTLAPVETDENGESIVCCVEDGETVVQDSPSPPTLEELVLLNITNQAEFLNGNNAACVSFSVDFLTDPVFTGRTCLPLVRSESAAEENAQGALAGPREQVDVVTSYVDGSMVYGSTNEEAEALRSMKDGLLLTNDSSSLSDLPPGDILPTSTDPELPCVLSDEAPCFTAGDERVSEHPGLATMHSIWLREHNRIARALKNTERFRIISRKFGLSPKAADELLYQNARRVVVGEIQAINYGGFLPILLDSSNLVEFDLGFENSTSLFEDYDDTVDAAIRNEFAAAAFRLGHTLIRSEFSRTNEGKQFSALILREHFERVTEIVNAETAGLDSIANGLITDPAQSFDRKVSSEVADFLFESLGDSMDLLAINEARGRDHGLQPYVKYRELCGFGLATSFDDLKDDFDSETLAILSKLYENVADVDLFGAALAEIPFGSGIVGRTFQCLVGRQFQIAKVGDRFFFESHVPGFDNFVLSEVNELRKATLSRVLCDNVAGISSIQPNAFLQPSVTGNGLIACNDIQSLNLDVFRFRRD